MVFIYHNRKTWFHWLPDWVMRFFNEFHLGVAVFFVLSGFVIAYTYKEKPLQNGKEYSKYIFVRLARILPMYYIIVTLEFLRIGFLSTRETVVAYTVTQSFFNEFVLNGLPQAWSLTVELCFYLSAPFLFLHIRKHIPKTLLVMLLLLGAAIGLGLLLNHLHWNRDGFLDSPIFVLNNSIFGRFFEFCCGIFLAQVVTKTRTAAWLQQFKHQTLFGGIAVIISIILIALFQTKLYTNGGDTIGGALIRNFLFAFAMMIFIHGLIIEKTWVSWFLSTKLMIILGNASFIFYLIHLKVVYFKLWYWHVFPDRNFTIMWLVAIAAYYLIEKPLYELMKRWIVGKKKPLKIEDP